MVLNALSPHLHASVGVASIKTLVGMKFPMSFKSLLVMQPSRKVRSSWMAGLARFSRVFIHLYMVMASRSASKPL